ncbi:MAG: VWA domain-containing protein [Dehalococcoidia bacterium]|nr:VWA domain-containing protein [Dehalococcoidia bacterium]
MSLGQPLALLALLALLPLVTAWWYTRRRSLASAAVYGGSASLRRGLSPQRAQLRAGLLFAAVALVAVAIARPQWGGAEGAVTRRGIDVVIALDVSRSMTATDVQPSRSNAAAAGLDDMLAHLRGDRVGLVTFGGSAFARSPLTLDLGAVSFLVERAQLEGALVEPGTDFAKAIQTSLTLLDVPDRANSQAIVLLSDGENLGSNLDAAIAAARDRGVRVYTVAVGTEAGAAVPARTSSARPPATPGDENALSRADRTTLAHIAEQTGGGTRELQNIAGLAVEFARLEQSAFDEGSQRIPIERFQWFLGAALVLLVIQSLIPTGQRAKMPLAAGLPGARTIALTGSLLVALLLAGCGGTAAYRKVSEGNAAYDAGRYDDALAAYQSAKDLAPGNPIVDYNIGNTLNRLQRYEEAQTASRAAARLADRTGATTTAARALYASGNHAFSQNVLEDARNAYIEVLLRDPGDLDARHNLEVVLDLLTPPGQQPASPSPGANPTPTPQDGGPPGATPTAGAGQPGGSPTPGPGQPGATATPQGAATPGAAGQPNQPTQPGQGAESLSDQLNDLLANGVSLEEALAFLDRLRRESEASNLQPRAPAGNGLPDR